MSNKRNTEMELLSICVQMGWYGGRTMPVLLEAVPGCAKTQAVKKLGKLLGEYLKSKGVSDTFAVSTLVGPQTMPESIEGIPSPDQDSKSLRRLPLRPIRELIEAKYGIFFVDEITSASQQTGASMMTTIQDGIAGDETLPDTVARVMCCNPANCAAAGRDLSPPEINRVLKLKWELPMEDFLDYLQGGEGLMSHIRHLKSDWEQKHIGHASGLVVSFLRRNPSMINMMGSGAVNEAQASEPWASQRQWENFTRVLAAVLSLGELPNSDMAYLAASGTVGPAAADMLIAHLRDMDFPDPEDILKEAMRKPKKKETYEETLDRVHKSVPQSIWDRPDKTRAFLESLASTAQRTEFEDRAERWTAAFLVVEPVLDRQPDCALGAAKILANRKPGALKEIPAAAKKVFHILSKAGQRDL